MCVLVAGYICEVGAFTGPRLLPNLPSQETGPPIPRGPTFSSPLSLRLTKRTELAPQCHRATSLWKLSNVNWLLHFWSKPNIFILC